MAEGTPSREVLFLLYPPSPLSTTGERNNVCDAMSCVMWVMLPWVATSCCYDMDVCFDVGCGR